jgi:hypothetical protein
MATLLILANFLVGCSGHSVISTEAELAMAEAVYTAVTGRRVDLLNQCEMDLSSKEGSGVIGPQAGTALKAAIRQGKEGQWESAARSLDSLIRNHPPLEHK